MISLVIPGYLRNDRQMGTAPAPASKKFFCLERGVLVVECNSLHDILGYVVTYQVWPQGKFLPSDDDDLSHHHLTYIPHSGASF